MSARPFLVAALVLLAGCERTMPPYDPPVVEVQGVRQSFAAPPGGRDTAGLVAALRTFADGRMDALHVTLPSGPAMDRLAWQLQGEGVLPRKITRDVQLASRTVVATRYIASVAPCPALDFRGAYISRNATRPGFGCATLADLAAQATDPADLLGNAASPSPDPERAAVPVTRWRGFVGGDGGGSAQSAAPSLSAGGSASGH